MNNNQSGNRNLSEFMQYIISTFNNGDDRLPKLSKISQELKIGLSVLREQLEVAKVFGFVEVKPRTGIRRLPYSFLPAIQTSLFYAVAVDDQNFQRYSDLRTHIEKAYWYQSVIVLTPEDHIYLQEIIRQAKAKLNGSPPQIPHNEHRELHLSIYRRLNNPFVIGMLEAYWNAYESIGLNLYTDLHYLKHVWEYHERMVESICAGDYEAGYQLLSEHVDLLFNRPVQETNHIFE